jgi:hypothetical protein
MPTNTQKSTQTPRLRICHTNLRAILDELKLMFDAGNNLNLMLLCGPTGVGKTTLGDYLVEAELEEQATAMIAQPGFIPAIHVEAPSSGEKEFSWRLFYERILNALEGELDAPRTAYGVDPETGRVVRPMGPQTHRLAGLRTAVERSLRQRKTRFIVVDEAAHIMRQCRAHRLEMQLDTLKSLSNECGVQWILLGSYDLFELLSLSGQLARRTHVLHFARYRIDNEEDVIAFRACLKQFGKWFPSLSDLDLLPYSEVFHENTLGCIGTLRAVLERLDRFVMARGWSEETLRSALLTETQMTQIMREIVEGEERIAPGLKRSICLNNTPNKRKVA